MFKQCVAILVTAGFLAGTTVSGEELENSGRDKTRISPFVDTVVHGTAMGAFTGLAAGWVRYADRHEMQNVWESAGYGALGGLGAGVAAALIGRDGKGNMVLNDIDRVSGFGGGTGFMWGIVSALFTGDSRRIANGMAWGHLTGFVLGMGVAGYKIAAGKYDVEERMDEQPVQCSIDFFEDSASLAYAGIKARKRF